MMPLSRKVSDVFSFVPPERVNRVVTSFEVDIASDACRLVVTSALGSRKTNCVDLSPDYWDGADFTPEAKTGS